MQHVKPQLLQMMVQVVAACQSRLLDVVGCIVFHGHYGHCSIIVAS
jgi:hypothetical protein